MHIIIGETPKTASVGDRAPQVTPGVIEAKVLNVRPARNRRTGTYSGQDKRVGNSASQDPPSGRVMVLLIPEGYKIPKDIQSGNYRTLLRFVRR